jgi:hypothetical protein
LSTSVSNDQPKYISFTVTNKIIGETEDKEFESHVFCYDLQTHDVQEVGVVPYNSQYPLTAYDRPSNKIYYSASTLKGERQHTGDQLYSLDLNTNETERLTEGLYAINYIIPTENEVNLIAAPLGVTGVRLYPYSWDKTSGILKNLSWDEDMMFRHVSWRPGTSELFARTYSVSEFYRRLENQGETMFFMPDSEIYSVDMRTGAHEKLFGIESTNLIVGTDIEVFTFVNNKIIASVSEEIKDGFAVRSERGLYSYDLSDNERTIYQYGEKLKGLSQFVYISDDERYVYYISITNTDVIANTLCVYDTEEDKTDVIYEAALGFDFINNATILADY